MALWSGPVQTSEVDPESLKLAEEIESSRKEIEKLQERVRQLVSRRGKRAELVKTAQKISMPELSAEVAAITNAPIRPEAELGRELSIQEGLDTLKATTMSDVRLIAFKHGAVIFLFANDRTVTVRMDERGPKPLLDLLTANDQKKARASARVSSSSTERPNP